MKRRILIGLSVLVGSWNTPLLASEKLSGTLTVTKACQAFHSIRKQRNPIDLVVGDQYSVVAKNKVAASHYQIKVNGDSRAQWVAVECGDLVLSDGSKATSSKQLSKEYLLALSWQPGFCYTHTKKKECRSASNRDYSASHFSLHGLWPQPRANAYCDVSRKTKSIDRRGRWDLLKPLVLSETTKQSLQKLMSGYTSLLQRHEWIKHGTCYGTNEEQYYVDSLQLTKAVNDTALDELFTRYRGKQLPLKEIQKTLAADLGQSAAKKVALRCGRKNQITEIWIGLAGDVPTTPLKTLMESGTAPSSNCQAGKVTRY